MLLWHRRDALLGAVIEQNHDDKGIVWPDAIAPFSVVALIGYGKSQQVRQVADQLYAQLQSSGVDVLLDDRDERPGVMFAEMELIGVPHRITIGERALKEERSNTSIGAHCRPRRFRLPKHSTSCEHSSLALDGGGSDPAQTPVSRRWCGNRRTMDGAADTGARGCATVRTHG